MPRHSPTRRNRRERDWSRSGPPEGDEDFDADLADALELEELRAIDPELDLALELEPDPDWKPARRDSRLPDWIPLRVQLAVRFLLRGAIGCVVLFFAAALFYLVLSFRYDVSEITSMPERTVIFDVRGQELATLHGESRRLITREEIPPFLVEALEAREDKRFFRHHGVDLTGLARATLRNLSDLSFTQGASTLTMQLARNSFELREKNLHRKLIEIAIALRIERSFGKDDILTAYVNRIYFGSGCHGLEEAARRYFGVSARDLNKNQGALLVGIIRAPHACSPLRNLEGALKQRDEVLARLVSEGRLSRGEADAIKELELGLQDANSNETGSFALQAVRRHFEELVASREIRDGGLRVRCTIHSEIQSLLENETAALVERIPGDLQVAAVCINARTGGIRGIIGGRASGNTTFNRALDARRDLGSVFTPFIYAAAAERGLQPMIDQPVRTGREVGHEDLVRLARFFGFDGPFRPGDDLYRGGLSVTPLEVATAAATLSNGGNRPRTFFLRDLRDAGRDRLFEIEPSVKPMLAAASTRASLAMQFPDGEPRLLVGASPAKTDVWGVSVGSLHTICIWIGHDKPRRLDALDTLVDEVTTAIRRMALSLLP